MLPGRWVAGLIAAVALATGCGLVDRLMGWLGGTAASERPAVAIQLTPVARGFSQITDLQFVPGLDKVLIVLEKEGTAHWVDLPTGKRGKLWTIPVRTASEMGLLGLAFHPRFPSNRRIFLNYVTTVDGKDTTVIAEWTLPAGFRAGDVGKEVQRLLFIRQPYVNHDGGQVQFGPDGKLYIGMGDGGSAGDPQGHGQNPASLLGKMLRIDVDKKDPGKAYAVPADNPFVGKAGWAPEIWALGLRNPWRFSFDPQGRLVAADVGQDRWEEIDIVERGGNYGWKHREGRHCYSPEKGCKSVGLKDPVFEYGRGDGQSVTGGYVWTSPRVPALNGKYLFGDFTSGQLWALDLPARADGTAKAWDLGRHDVKPSTFGRDLQGEVYVGDFSGTVLRIDPAK